jgi:TolB-like protein
MNRFAFIGLPVFIALVLASASLLWAGQVVTEEIRNWAKDALQQEGRVQPKTDPNTVAVLYFRNQTGQRVFDDVEKGLALMLITDLSKIKKLRLVERVRLEALLRETELGKSGLVAPGTEPKVGKLLGAGFIIGGELAKGVAAAVKADARTVSVAKAAIVDQSMSQGQLEDLMRMEKELLFDIVETLKIELSKPEIEALRKPISKNIKAVLSMFKGLSSSDRGDYLRAADFYRTALGADPGLTLAKNALKELDTLGLIGSKERSGRLLKSIKGMTSLTDQIYDDTVVERETMPGRAGQRDAGSLTVEW